MQMTWAGCPNFKGSLSVARWANLCNSINATRGKLLRKPRWWLQELVRQWCTVGGFCRSGGGRSLRPENLGNKLGFLGKINIKRSEEHTSELQSRFERGWRLLLG